MAVGSEQCVVALRRGCGGVGESREIGRNRGTYEEAEARKTTTNPMRAPTLSSSRPITGDPNVWIKPEGGREPPRREAMVFCAARTEERLQLPIRPLRIRRFRAQLLHEKRLDRALQLIAKMRIMYPPSQSVSRGSPAGKSGIRDQAGPEIKRVEASTSSRA